MNTPLAKLKALNFLDAFIAGAIGIMLPLLLVERKVDVSTIGIIFAILPLVYAFARLAAATVADKKGFRPFYIGNGLGNLLHVVFYLIGGHWLIYLFGKMSEGAKVSLLWAVNRTAITRSSSAKALDRLFSTFSALRTLAFALGAFVIGITISSFGFDLSLFFLIAISLLVTTIAFTLPKAISTKVKPLSLLQGLNLFKKRRGFKRTAFTMSLEYISIEIIMDMVIPIYMLTVGYSIAQIGLYVSMYYLIDGLTAYFLSHTKFPLPKIAVIQTALYCPAILIPLVLGPGFLPYALVLMAVARGCNLLTWEGIIVNVTKGSPTFSVDVALLHAPGNIVYSAGFLACGFVIQSFGYLPVFIVSAAVFAAYSFSSYKLLKK